MSELRSDEETVEQIQRWWSENGTTLVVTLVLVFGGYFGWNWWQAKEQARIADHSARYLQWLEAARPDEVTPEAERLAAEILEADPASPYAALIRFDAARRAVDRGDADAARTELEAIRAQPLATAMLDVARMRLARLALADGDSAGALALLGEIRDAEALPTVLELRGDAHRAAGDPDAARAAYDAAIEASARVQNAGLPLLEMKRDDLAIPDATFDAGLPE